MVEIEDRGRTFKSWEAYAKALEKEVKCLQQFLTSDRVALCAKSVGCYPNENAEVIVKVARGEQDVK